MKRNEEFEGGANAPVVPQGTISDEEAKLREDSAIATEISNLIARKKDQWDIALIEELQGLEKVDRSLVPEHYSDPAPHRGTIPQSNPTEPIYRHMSEELREWRNPDSDHYMAEWLKGVYHKDHGRRLEAEAKLDGMFGRADLHEGTVGASGALATGTGGSLAPRPLESVVLISRDRVAKMRRFSSLMTMTAQTHTIPTAAAMTAGMVAEGSTQGEGNPTVASVQISAMKGQVKAIVSEELLADAAANLVSALATRAGGALGVLEDNQTFRLGSGTAPNTVKIDGNAFTETTSGILPYSDVLSMYYSVPQEYRDQAIWMVAANVLQLMSNVRDGQGRPFYQGLTDVPGALTDDSGQVGAILRRPVFEVPFSDGDIWFGDPKAAYVLGTRQGITVKASEHVNFTSDEIMWKWTQRFGGINVDHTAAAEYAKGITSATSL